MNDTNSPADLHQDSEDELPQTKPSRDFSAMLREKKFVYAGRKRKKVNYDEGSHTEDDTGDFDSGNTSNDSGDSENKLSKNNTLSNGNKSDLKFILKKIPRDTSNKKRKLSRKEEWESKSSNNSSVALCLGNKRPRYAKDGVKRKANGGLSSENSDIDEPSTNYLKKQNGSETAPQRSSRGSRSSRRGSNYEVTTN